MTCATCSYGRKDGDNVRCIRHPPSVQAHLMPAQVDLMGRPQVQQITVTNWPVTKPDDVCGEYKGESSWPIIQQ